MSLSFSLIFSQNVKQDGSCGQNYCSFYFDFEGSCRFVTDIDHKHTFLGTFAKFRKATLSFVMSVRRFA
jgi:hypothetical protein